MANESCVEHQEELQKGAVFKGCREAVWIVKLLVGFDQLGSCS